MKIGIPKEVKTHEYRVGLTPEQVRQLALDGHSCFVQRNAGTAIGFTDEDYALAGAELVPDNAEVYQRADLIVKVKEPQPQECEQLRPGQTLFCFLHLAASKALTENLLEKRITGIAFETVTDEQGRLPLLAPMSEIAGRMAVQAGVHHLENPQGGRGVLLGGINNVEAGRVVIVGGGVVGTQAARVALGLGGDVLILEKSEKRLAELEREFKGKVKLAVSDAKTVAAGVGHADMVVGAVLVSGARAPNVLTRDHIRSMPPGSVAVDVAIDQGGCFETSKPTTHDAPTYVVDDVIHYCVANIPGAVARTSTQALSNATFPYVRRLANEGVNEALKADAHFLAGLNVFDGKLSHGVLAESLGMEFVEAGKLL